MFPAWIGGYVGLPWSDAGTERDGLNCWGLVALVYRERFGIDLDHVGTAAGDVASVDARTLAEQTAAHWRAVDLRRASFGDVVLMRPMGRFHVGLVVEPWRMLHSFPHRLSAIEWYDRLVWRSRIVALYRHRDMPQHDVASHSMTERAPS